MMSASIELSGLRFTHDFTSVQLAKGNGIIGSQGGNMPSTIENLRELLQDNLLVAFDHLTDEEKTVMCQVVVDTINTELAETQEA